MNKCIKITIKNCNEINNYKKILKDLRYQSWLACNKTITYLYTFAVENMEYKNKNGININEKERFGKSYGSWVENRMNETMDIHNSGNVAQTRQFVSNRFKDDVKKGLFKGQISLSNFKQNIPLIIHNNNYKISQGNKGFEIECSLFNRIYQKENDIKRVNFNIDSLDNNQKSILNKIILGLYKQGSAQIKEDKKGKWYLIISFSFEPTTLELDKNKILGIDLGLVNTAVMQIFDTTIQQWDKLSWKEYVINGKEIMYFRQKLDARKRQIQIASKIVGNGRVGHGTKTRMKPFNDIGDKVARFKDTYNHKVSKYIVDFAVKNNCGTIQMENLSGFSEQQSDKFLKNWAYHDLQTKIQYKCEEKGIKFILIDPKYTSKRCSECGCIDENNRDCKGNQAKFKCVKCGHEENADVNAAKNISIPMIDSIIKEELKINLSNLSNQNMEV
jgi:IS605 OrfB family transposase